VTYEVKMATYRLKGITKSLRCFSLGVFNDYFLPVGVETSVKLDVFATLFLWL